MTVGQAPSVTVWADKCKQIDWRLPLKPLRLAAASKMGEHLLYKFFHDHFPGGRTERMLRPCPRTRQ